MRTDVLIVGGGPAGATGAMFLAAEGIRPIIVEREPFPRYHIGESMTGECGAVLRDLGLEQRMLADEHPVKQGVKVYSPNGKTEWFVPVMGRDANWTLFDQFTWQVRRSNFDQMLLDEAVARGATILRGTALKPLLRDDGSVRGAQIRMADGGTVDVESEMLLDCSGQATFLANAGVTGPKYLGSYDKQIAIFSQVTGAARDDGTTRDAHKDNTLIFYEKKYHWAWLIPLDGDVVSVGVVVPAAYFLEKRETKKTFLVRELHEMNADLKRRLPEITLIEDVHVIPNYSFQVRQFCGKGFMCIGDAHRFLDPIFSFGLYVSMKEAQFAAPLIKAYLAGAQRDDDNPFASHQLRCEKGIDVLEDTIDLFWEQPFAFAAFVHARYREYFTDILAGRVYERQPSPAVTAVRKMLKREEERNRSYQAQDLYSMPIGSRFHPERSALWEPNSTVETTEAWMGPR
jgi:flavin-dependent dehydrogenase